MLRRALISIVACAGFASVTHGGAAPEVTSGTFKTSDGVALSYGIGGQGAPALFVHGGPGSGSAGFRALAGEKLERSYKMIWLDQRGSGKSQSAPDRNYSLDRQLQDLEELRAHLGIDEWSVMAYSFGGVIAQAYAQTHSSHVRSLILVNALLDLGASMQVTVDNGLPLLPENQRPPFGADVPLPNRFFTVMGMLQKSGLGWRLQTSSEEVWKRVAAATPGGANNEMARAIFERGPGRYADDFTKSTAAVELPVLVVAGDGDLLVGTQHTRFGYPRKTEVILRGGHLSFYEDLESFARAVERFARSERRN